MAGPAAAWRLALPALATLMLGVAVAPAKAADCAAIGNLTPYCGLPHPEDLEVLPGGAGVIASDMHIATGPAGIVGRPGSLKWLDPKTRAVTVLYPSATAPPGRADWGDPTCPGEIGAALLPHGFHLSQRSGGGWQLLVVNHGDRESVEFFELTGKGDQWFLSWRGCAVPPPPNRLNDVVATPGGGLLVTTMHRTGATGSSEAAKSPNPATGLLWRWTPGQGFSEQAGSAAPRPNGVQIDAVGRYAYLSSAAGGGEVRKVDLVRGEVVGTASVPKPDNSSWTADGRLLVTGMTPDADGSACFVTPAAPCPAAFDVYAIDPASMRAERIFSHSGAPLGGGTVAVQYGSDLMIGSFAGDRVMAVRDFFKPGSREPAARMDASPSGK
ncbi:hypothetical protein LJR225_004720 [Phenylobacterium sp. LjRoot225]|uniref:hypothetical protein n=1 Tax=Phenylobacterium sp. LjRoot225 TaxID=3342285 RepID=UPI003ECF7DE5